MTNEAISCSFNYPVTILPPAKNIDEFPYQNIVDQLIMIQVISILDECKINCNCNLINSLTPSS
jgi:hypothetical protein